MFNSPIMPEFPLPVTFVGMSQQPSCCQAIVWAQAVLSLDGSPMPRIPAASKANSKRHFFQDVVLPALCLSMCLSSSLRLMAQGWSSSRLLLAWSACDGAICASAVLQAHPARRGGCRGLCWLRKGYSVCSPVCSIQRSSRCPEPPPPCPRPTLCSMQGDNGSWQHLWRAVEGCAEQV